MQHIFSTKDVKWQPMQTTANTVETIKTTLSPTKKFEQTWEGFGGCFNELSQIAILKLPEKKQAEIYDMLFCANSNDLNFDFCRLPIGASDYAEKWYSHNETESDFEMKQFSIDRDRKYLIPYIKQALNRNKEIKLFASPWSPPTWMKNPPVYNYGTLIWSNENLSAYALYLLKFVQEYEKEGIHISQLHIQNEPVSSQKFPSCIWTGEQFTEFINDYIGPLFEKHAPNTKIWLGTLNGPETDDRKLYTRYDDYANIVLHDEQAYKYIEGVSYQWAGQYALQKTQQSFPEKKYMQTENECGDGTNTWEYAKYIFELFHHYISNNVCAYIYWNMILEEGGKSSWGWTQNSMLTVKKCEDGTFDYHKEHEYYIMKHFSRFIRPGAKRISLDGHLSSNSIYFENIDSTKVLVVKNPFKKSLAFTFENSQIILPADSINTIVF